MIRGIDDYEQALRQIGEYSDISDENTDDSSEVDSDVDAPDSDSTIDYEYELPISESSWSTGVYEHYTDEWTS